jgi:glycerol-3-phosphate dehydrogenase
MDAHFDLLIIGGGINGCGIARDAAGRGFRVCLCEMNDLASGTSSWSTKLIHGGLRYLEHYEFRLVREALIEREVLWANAPHVIRPLRFVLPHHEGLRPAWLLRLGLFLYDHLGGRKLLPPTRTLDLRQDAAGEPLKPIYRRGFEYSDCWVDDARLVVLNARDAAERGADIRTRTWVAGAEREERRWRVQLRDETGQEVEQVTADLLVNASGPWVDQVLKGVLGRNNVRNVRLVQGSHIVLPKLYNHERSYIFQNSDGRIVFALPYEEDFTLVGTTDRDYQGDPGRAEISAAEIDYLCAAVGGYFKTRIEPGEIVWSFSGVRPLYDEGASKAQEATRDYVLKTEKHEGSAPLINIFGGKITTYRKLAEAVLSRTEKLLGARGESWTAKAPLPGGDFPVDGLDQLEEKLAARYAFLSPSHIRRLIRQYGTDSFEVLGEAKSLQGLGQHFGSDLYEGEVNWLVTKEWARTAEDVAWRRTKLGLKLAEEELKRLECYMKAPVPVRRLTGEAGGGT